MKGPKDERVVFMLDKELRQTLDSYSEKTGMPISEVMRRALAEYLKRERK
ncbi:MAG: ribbon-helix-helix domain-containing protein [Ktedonobacteraceae bacterium]